MLNFSGVPEGACGPAELAKFQAVIPEFQIKVFSATSQVEVLYKGPEAGQIIYLILDEKLQHYNVINGKVLTWNISIFDLNLHRQYSHSTERSLESKWLLWSNCAETTN